MGVLLDEGTYLASVPAYYRILRQAGETRERRAQAPHPAAVKPELVATGPNQMYSWDITKLHGPAKWTYYYLYVILDIYSRYAVGWMLATCESAALAEKLIAETCAKQRITDGQLADRAPGQPPAAGNSRPGHGQRPGDGWQRQAAHKGGTGDGKSRLARRDGRYCAR